MTQFDWKENIKNHVFKTWLDNGGAGVKIALLDTGMDLTHPALKQLDNAGRKFNAADPSFNPANPLVSGNGSVVDAYRMKGHGTQCASVLASQATTTDSLLGFVPEVELFIVKVNTVDNKFFRVKDFLRGLEAAANLGVDLVVASISYLPSDLSLEGISTTEVDRVFGLLAASGAVLFAALPNKDPNQPWIDIAASNFPSLRKEALNVGAISEPIFQSRRAEIDAEPGVYFLVSNVQGQFCKINGEYVQEAISSSYATYLVAGVAALYISSIKKREKEAYKPRPLSDFMAGLSQNFIELLQAQAWDATVPVFYKTSNVKTEVVDPV